MGTLAFPNLDAAIGVAEGYGKPGTIPTLANNPGDVSAGPFATKYGAIGSITAAGGNQIAVFPDSATGLSATDALVASKVNSGQVTDLSSFAQSWLGQGASSGDVSNYAGNLQAALGSNPSGLPGSVTPTSTPPASWLSGVTSAITGAASSGVQSMFGLTIGRAAAFILGLIVIGAALFLFKPVQNVAVGAVRRAGAAVAV